MRGDGIRRRKDRGGAWYYTWVDASGRRHKRRARHQTFTGARHELEQERAKVKSAKETGYVPMTFKEAAQEYIARQKPLVSKAEHERQASILKLHLGPFFAGKLGEISKRAVNQYVTLRSRSVSPGTVRKEVGCLKHLLNWAMDNGLIPSNPATRITMPRVPAGRLRYLQPTELTAVVEFLPPWVRPVVLLAVSTGMRRGEILNLRWLDLDLVQRVINLPQSKNGKGRTVYLNEAALDVFRSLSLEAGLDSAEPVFGLDTTPGEVSMTFMRACRKVGIMDFRFHDLRHTHATWLRQSGVQLDEIAKQLGHSDLRMTQRYAHLGQSQVREAVDRLDAILRPLQGPEPEIRIREAKLTRVN